MCAKSDLGAYMGKHVYHKLHLQQQFQFVKRDRLPRIGIVADIKRLEAAYEGLG